MKKREIKYLLIYRQINDLLEKKEYKPFDFIPKEEELCKIYSACRPTLAKALDLLVKEGRLKRIKGKGTIVLSVLAVPKIVTGQSVTIGVIIPAVSQINHTKVLCDSVKLCCKTSGIKYIVAEPYSIENMMNQMIHLSRDINGLIVYPWSLLMLDTVRQLKARNVPLVLINNYFQDESTAAVIPDFHKAAYMATAYLISRGHRQIAHITQAKAEHKVMGAIKEFRGGYQKALGDHGLSFDRQLIEETTDGDNIQRGYTGIRNLLANRKEITAVVAFNDLIAVGVIKALQELTIKVPDDISVIGFGDDIELHAIYDHGECPLSTVSANREILGFKAVDRLHELILNKNNLPASQIRIEPKLILRKTCKEIS